MQRAAILVLITGMIAATLHEFTHIFQHAHHLCDTTHHHADQDREDEHHEPETNCFYCTITVVAPLSDYSWGEIHFRTIIIHSIHLTEQYSPSVLTDFFLRAPPQIIA